MGTVPSGVGGPYLCFPARPSTREEPRVGLGQAITISDREVAELIEACGLDQGEDAARIEVMLTLTRLVLAEHPGRAARDAGPQTGHKIESLGRGLKHLRAFAEESRAWHRAGPMPRTGRDASDGLVSIWRLVALHFDPPVTGNIVLGGEVLPVGDAFRVLSRAAREIMFDTVFPAIADALVQAVEAAYEDLERRVAETPAAGIKHAPRKDGRRLTMIELCHVFDAFHRVEHEGDRRAAKLDFVRAALLAVDESIACGTIENFLRGPELGEYVGSLEAHARAQGLDAAALEQRLLEIRRCALDTPGPLDFDAARLLSLIRDPDFSGLPSQRAAWVAAVSATGVPDRLREAARLLGRPELPVSPR